MPPYESAMGSMADSPVATALPGERITGRAPAHMKRAFVVVPHLDRLVALARVRVERIWAKHGLSPVGLSAFCHILFCRFYFADIDFNVRASAGSCPNADFLV